VALSRSAINRLGKTIRDSDDVSQIVRSDVFLEYRSIGAGVQSEFHRSIVDLLPDHSVSSRVKTIGTIKEKLQREQSLQLSNMDDAVGIRVTSDMTLYAQDEIARRLLTVYPDSVVKDRRLNPTSGYRALHLIVRHEILHIEIQIRTEIQSIWANAFERLADDWGRQIRYGGDPTCDVHGIVSKRRDYVQSLAEISLNELAFLENEISQVSESATKNRVQRERTIDRIRAKPRTKEEARIAFMIDRIDHLELVTNNKIGEARSSLRLLVLEAVNESLAIE
jgi:ppGpp synthetase/RelA/SpoT-type nucleotidyltranferase